MINRFLIIAVLITCIGLNNAAAQDKDLKKDYYLSAAIPDSMKENAHAVERYVYSETTIKSPDHIYFKYHSIVTILDEKGNNEAVFHVQYNKKFNTINSAEMSVYGADGKLIKKYKKGDMYDHAAIDDETLFNDERVLLAGHTIASYPITVEMIYDEDRSGFIDDTWNISNANHVSVENNICKMIVNPTAGFRYKNVNTGIGPQKENQNGFDTYTWTARNIKAEKPEEGSPDWLTSKKIVFAVDKFEFYGKPGALDSWQDYGKWIAALNADVNTLPPAREAEIRKMTDTIKDDRRKVKFLYNYMQQNMRYVSVQLGIGGLKPFPAKFVDEKKYGDCKALVNYMYALLKAVNIPSYYSIVTAGANGEAADPSFPANPFNHIILCVPFKGDTTWLECTNMQQSFGKLGDFTENRNALLITEDGGKLVNTPHSTMGENRFDSFVHLALNADGSAKANLRLLSTGDCRHEYLGLSSIKQDEQKQVLMRYLNIKQPLFFDIKDGADRDDVKETDIDLEYDRFCDVMSGDREFYRPGVLDLWNVNLPETDKRKYDYYFDHPTQQTCTTTIDVPANFNVESLPVDVNLKFSYGNYQSTYKYDAAKNQVTAIVKFNLNSQVIPAAKYAEMQDYMAAVSKAQNKKMVIKRKG